MSCAMRSWATFRSASEHGLYQSRVAGVRSEAASSCEPRVALSLCDGRGFLPLSFRSPAREYACVPIYAQILGPSR
jgi:hypothetical protein